MEYEFPRPNISFLDIFSVIFYGSSVGLRLHHPFYSQRNSFTQWVSGENFNLQLQAVPQKYFILVFFDHFVGGFFGYILCCP